MIRYEDEILPSADSRPYVRTSIANFDNVTPSQKFTSCSELLSESEFHITEEDLIECCNKVEVEVGMEVMTKAVNNNIDAPEGGDKNNKTIVDIIFEDFSTTPFNSPTASTEKNLERSPLFILREKPKRCYSRKEKVKSNLEENFKAAVDGKNDKHLLNDPNDPISEASDLDYNAIEKKDTRNINEVLCNGNSSRMLLFLYALLYLHPCNEKGVYWGDFYESTMRESNVTLLPLFLMLLSLLLCRQWRYLFLKTHKIYEFLQVVYVYKLQDVPSSVDDSLQVAQD
uniref:Uncharacterized protein n=1 Tax=Glossina austeni TaxID=7395 RepID=A0A1A9V519_GLOAU